ncbi:MAG TPA: hypothetical protein VFZ95_03890 [Steroidobacteraceae bacterium]
MKDIGELTTIADALQSAGYLLEGTDGQGARWFRRSFEDGGMLSPRVQRDCVYVDTHANWRDVGDLYRTIVTVAPELLLFDPQKCLFHDARSFDEFCERSYRELEARRLR